MSHGSIAHLERPAAIPGAEGLLRQSRPRACTQTASSPSREHAIAVAAVAAVATLPVLSEPS